MPDNGRITSPDQLNNYIRVTSPGTWVVLAAILMLLAGLFFWLFTGQLEVSLQTAIFTNGDDSSAFLTREQLHGIKPGNAVRVLNTHTSGVVRAIASEPLPFTDIEKLTGRDNAERLELDYSPYGLFTVSLSITDAPQGVSQAVIVLDTIKPISFLLR